MNLISEKTKKAIVYDATVKSPILWLSWRVWAWVLLITRRVTHVYGARSWPDAFANLIANASPITKWDEVQVWCHGRPGEVLIGISSLNATTALIDYSNLLEQLNTVLAPDGLLWFRSCSTFGGQRGLVFVTEMTDKIVCPLAGFTTKIGPWQSGLHYVASFEDITWPATENDGGMAWGKPWLPNTVPCLQWWIP